jgi:hypothetical protein
VSIRQVLYIVEHAYKDVLRSLFIQYIEALTPKVVSKDIYSSRTALSP